MWSQACAGQVSPAAGCPPRPEAPCQPIPRTLRTCRSVKAHRRKPTRTRWTRSAHRDTPPARVSCLEVSRLRDIEGDRKVNRTQSGRAESPRLARLDRTPVRLRGYGRVVAILPWLIAGEWVLSPANRN